MIEGTHSLVYSREIFGTIFSVYIKTSGCDLTCHGTLPVVPWWIKHDRKTCQDHGITNLLSLPCIGYNYISGPLTSVKAEFSFQSLEEEAHQLMLTQETEPIMYGKHGTACSWHIPYSNFINWCLMTKLMVFPCSWAVVIWNQ